MHLPLSQVTIKCFWQREWWKYRLQMVHQNELLWALNHVIMLFPPTPLGSQSPNTFPAYFSAVVFSLIWTVSRHLQAPPAGYNDVSCAQTLVQNDSFPNTQNEMCFVQVDHSVLTRPSDYHEGVLKHVCDKGIISESQIFQVTYSKYNTVWNRAPSGTLAAALVPVDTVPRGNNTPVHTGHARLQTRFHYITWATLCCFNFAVL